MADVSMYTQGTIHPAADADIGRKAEEMMKALKGLGTDEDTVIRILTELSNDQRQQLKALYKTKFGKDLVTDLKGDLSGYFEQTVLALLVPAREYDVMNLNKAISNGGDRRIVVDLLCAQRNEGIEKLKADFQQKFNRTIDQVIGNQLKGDFKKLVLALLNAKRDTEVRFVDEDVQADAQALYKAGEGRLGTDESKFIEVLTTRSFEHLRQMYDAYKKLSGNTMEKAIQGETSAEFKAGLLGIVMYSRDPLGYYSARIMKSMKGLGTDDESLIRLLVSRSELDLANVKSAFIKNYKKTLQQWVEDDTSGDYRKILVAIVRGNADVARRAEDSVDLSAIGEVDPSKPFVPDEA